MIKYLVINAPHYCSSDSAPFACCRTLSLPEGCAGTRYDHNYFLILKLSPPEDLGTGHCHNQGVGWRGDLLDQRDLLGNITEEDNGTISVDIFWSLLVERPRCVDRLSVTRLPAGQLDTQQSCYTLNKSRTRFYEILDTQS